MTAMTNRPNHNYRIATKLVRPGVIRARAVGRIRRQLTMKTSSYACAAAELAQRIEGDRFAEVVLNLQTGIEREYVVYVKQPPMTTPTEERRAAALAEAQAENEAARAARPALADPHPWEVDPWYLLGRLMGELAVTGQITRDSWNDAVGSAKRKGPASRG